MPKRTLEEVKRDAVGKKQQRQLSIGIIDEEARTVELSFSSEAPYGRYWGTEILGHGEDEVRLGRLRDGGAVMVNHRGDQIGVVEDARIDPEEKKGRALLRFSQNTDPDEPRFGNKVFADIVDGIRRNVSVGYEIHRLTLVEQTEEEDVYRATDWEPFEISIVNVPADPNVGVGRAKDEPSPAPADDTAEAKSTVIIMY